MIQHTTPHDGDFLMTSAVARLLNVAQSTVILWDRLGKLRAIRTENGRRLFLRTDVERLAKERSKR
jgi:DNA-binding transcriptional MerR regulator